MTTLLDRPGSSSSPSWLADPDTGLYVRQSQGRGGAAGLVVLVIAGVVIWVASRGSGRAVPPQEMPGTDAARVGGSLGSISVSATVPQASHQLPKDIGGAIINVRYAWFGDTRDAGGTAINWPYQLITRMGHNTLFGWRQATDLLPVAPLLSQSAVHETTRGENAVSTIFGVPNDPGQEWDFRVWLFALRSDAQGNPIGTPTEQISGTEDLDSGVQDVGQWRGLAYAQHPGAIISVEPDATATVSGRLGIVTVTQPQRHLLGSIKRRAA